MCEAIEKSYAGRLEKDIASFFEFDPVRGVYTGMIGLNLSVLWDTIKDFSDNFEERTEAFFILFKELLRRGHLKLQRDGKIIEHTPEEWERIFRGEWPKSDMPYGAYEGDIIIWFTHEDCPAYAVWIDPEDGSEYWAG